MSNRTTPPGKYLCPFCNYVGSAYFDQTGVHSQCGQCGHALYFDARGDDLQEEKPFEQLLTRMHYTLLWRVHRRLGWILVALWALVLLALSFQLGGFTVTLSPRG